MTMIILIRVLNEYQIIIDSSVPLKNNGKKNHQKSNIPHTNTFKSIPNQKKISLQLVNEAMIVFVSCQSVLPQAI